MKRVCEAAVGWVLLIWRLVGGSEAEHVSGAVYVRTKSKRTFLMTKVSACLVPRDSHPFLRKGDISISRSGAYGDPYFK